jgi:hypothetical protein
MCFARNLLRLSVNALVGPWMGDDWSCSGSGWWGLYCLVAVGGSDVLELVVVSGCVWCS